MPESPFLQDSFGGCFWELYLWNRGINSYDAQTSVMDIFCDNILQLFTVNYFAKNFHHRFLKWVLKALLKSLSGLYSTNFYLEIRKCVKKWKRSYNRGVYIQMYSYFEMLCQKFQCGFQKNFTAQYCLISKAEKWRRFDVSNSFLL